MTENLEVEQTNNGPKPATFSAMGERLNQTLMGQRTDRFNSIMAENHPDWLKKNAAEKQADQDKLTVTESLAKLPILFDTVDRVKNNLHTFLRPREGLTTQQEQLWLNIDLGFEDLTLLETLQAQVEQIIHQPNPELADVDNLRNWLLTNVRALELLTGNATFSPVPELQRVLKLLLASSTDTARGLMSPGGAIIETFNRMEIAKNAHEPSIVGPSPKINSLLRSLKIARTMAVTTILVSACGTVTAPAEVEPTPVVSEREPKEDATLVPEIKPEPGETPNADDELTATTEITATETITPTGFIYTGISIGGTEIDPVATEITPENKNAIEIREPLLVELMSEIEWQDGTKIVGFMYQNDIRARVTEGGSVDGTIEVGDVLFLGEGLEVDHNFKGREGEVAGDEETFNPEEEIQTIKDRLAIMSKDLVEASLILRPAESGKQEFVLQAGDEEMVIGTLGFDENDQAVIIRGGERYPVAALQVENGQLMLEEEKIGASAYAFTTGDDVVRILIQMNIKKLRADEPPILLETAPTLKREVKNLFTEQPNLSVEQIIQYLKNGLVELSPEENTQFINQLRTIESFYQQSLDPESIPEQADPEIWEKAVHSAVEHNIDLAQYPTAKWDESLHTLLLQAETEKNLPNIAYLFESMCYLQYVSVPDQYVNGEPLELIHATDVAEEGYVDFSEANLQVVSDIIGAGRDWMSRALVREDHQDLPSHRLVLGVLNGVDQIPEYKEEYLLVKVSNIAGAAALRLHPVYDEEHHVIFAQGGFDWPYNHTKIAEGKRQTSYYLTAPFMHATSCPRQAEYNEAVSSFRNSLTDMAEAINSAVPGYKDQNPANLHWVSLK